MDAKFHRHPAPPTLGITILYELNRKALTVKRGGKYTSTLIGQYAELNKYAILYGGDLAK